MNRYNIFYQVHKGLRAMLYETAIAFQQTDFTNAEDAETLLAQLEIVIDLFDRHAHSEDTKVFIAIEQFEHSLVNTFNGEHEEDHGLGIRIRGLITEFANAVSVEDKINSGFALNNAFVDFMIFNLRHMAKEEDVINKALWKYYSDIELQGITQQILAGIPAAAMGQYSRWMMRGLSNNEITGWLKEIKDNAPDFIFQSHMQMAAQELTPQRWKLVQESITEGAMIA
jgi:hemerythrin-like domain-containing protein